MQSKKIQLKDLKEGMKIKSVDNNGVILFKKVTKIMPTLVVTARQRHIVFANGTELHCSDNHPIMILQDDGKAKEVYPDDLSVWDNVITENGITNIIKTIKGDIRPENYIDITVDNTHTFFASSSETSEMVLTHNSQGGVRGGAATIYIPAWHLEFEDLIVLKNNKGTEENRVRHMDYAFQFNKTMYERLLTGGNITLFSPHDTPGLLDAFYADQTKFKQLYEKYEKDSKITKKVMTAIDLFSMFVTERKDTGRIYLMNVDHANEHGSFIPELAPIRQSNLCVEVNLPTRALTSADDSKGEIALCTLSAINWGLINQPHEFEKYCTLAVRALDALLDYQHYPVPAAHTSTMNRRPLGIGIINLAYFLAKRGLKYDSTALATVDEYAEAWSYYLIKASADLAAERGTIPLNMETKYSHGILPIDTYKKDVDMLVPATERMDWKGLREQLKTTGIRNSTLMALMPAETSAQLSNSTNGIEPPRALVSYKQSKDGVMAQVVPGYHHLKNKYDLLWDQKSPEGYLQICAILQKYIDQGISVNTSYNPEHFEDSKVPMSQLIKDIITFYKYGGKQLYYNNTNDQSGEILSNDVDMADDIDDNEDDCDSCKI